MMKAPKSLVLTTALLLLGACKSGEGGRCTNGGDECRPELMCVDDPQPPNGRCPGAWECPGTCRHPEDPRLASGEVTRAEPCANLRFTPPPGFVARADEPNAWVRKVGPDPPWDFLTLGCREVRDDAVDKEVAHLHRIYVENQREQPFMSAIDPAVKRLRQRTTLVTRDVAVDGALLVVRTEYPDGVPPGLVFEHVESFCVVRRGPALLTLRAWSPLSLETESIAGLRASFDDEAGVAGLGGGSARTSRSSRPTPRGPPNRYSTAADGLDRRRTDTSVRGVLAWYGPVDLRACLLLLQAP